MVLTIENLMQRKEKFDYVFIETSGLADPGPLASTFWLDEELESDIYLDAIVTIVDAKHFKQHLEEEKPKGVVNEAQRQVAFADRIIVNKTDLVSTEYLSELEQQIYSHNSVATVLRAERSRVDLEGILNVQAFELKRALEVDPHFITCCDDTEHSHEHEHKHKHQHDDSVKTVHLRCKKDVDLDKLHIWIGELLWEERSDEIFRMKGIVSVKGESQKYALQAVHSLFEVEPTEVSWNPNEERETIIVFIGRNLNQEELYSSFVESAVAERGAQK